MGARDEKGAQAVMFGGRPPKADEFELTLIGPEYGESIVLHCGQGTWVLVDSCGRFDSPIALQYLQNIGVDPSRAVAMIVATHWHDDHIRGIAQMVQVCANATFCCAGVLCDGEFLDVVDALEGRHYAAFGSGLREIHRVFSRLRETASTPTMAIANRHLLASGACRIWSLSPDDESFLRFLRAVARLKPKEGQAETRISSLSPNEVAVVLRVEVGDVAVLLGSDLERRGWRSILQDAARPCGTASVFKIPHHGSESADEPGTWQHLLVAEPLALLTPWRRGDRTLPRNDDVRRILTRTADAYATAMTNGGSPVHRDRVVERTIGQSGIKLRRTPRMGGIRLRRRIGARTSWDIELSGSACNLTAYLQTRP